MPTHRTGDVQQDPIRLKNLVNQAQDKLVAAGLRPAAAKELLRPVHNFEEDTLFWQNHSEGLALFISPNTFRFGHLPFRFAELVGPTVEGLPRRRLSGLQERHGPRWPIDHDKGGRLEHAPLP
jgi:hypothetical protein